MIQFGHTIAVLAIAFGVAVPTWALNAPTQAGLRFLSGGVGDGEIAEIKALAPNDSLQVLTADLAGQFIAGVHLTNKRDRSTILDTTLDSPYLLADLPAGTLLDALDTGRPPPFLEEIARATPPGYVLYRVVQP